ncbi:MULTISPECIES: hypothetical protein [unclassified Luteimonas]|uniref:hypothetical protein n=1 Tax=unclassified Luteimonas TaxID=2629088 RepID=UPI00160036DF|nr:MULTISPECIES: hypothetical protein [unclassified Luteimonas]MBB1472701.1 hypothetical protein [Luteimonas sp. MC1782]MBB6598594.1 hypothetical protein [Luteimonas sp. MC1825]QOC88771.1 hypothetical protein IDM46_03200 [Luteimonas sp. MC1825]
MKTILLASACLMISGAVHAQSQSGGGCPALPADSGLAWEKLDGRGYTFCKAIRASDGGQVLAVMLSAEAPFKPRRGDRVNETMIDGQPTWWYRGELADTTGVKVRETIVELGRDQVAHISLRAGSDQEMSQAMSVAESLHFGDVLVSSN